MTPQETAQRLLALDHILILTHRRPDGDTIGCASALCLALRQKGKTAWLLPNEDAHHLFDPYLEGVLAPADFVPQAVVAVDVAALGMLPDSARPYRDRIDLAIDHHGSQEGYARATCVDPDSAACGEVLFRVFQAMGVDLTPQIALLLYMAIATDTGCFVYSNTTPATHRIAAALMDTGFDAQWVNKRHFRVKSLKRMQIESRLVREMDLAQNGTLVFAYVTLDLIRDLQATEEDLEDIASFIGQLEGVDNAVTIRQLKPTECKISLRTDGKTLNASDVCAIHGGGGHPAAAGCTIHGTPAQAMAREIQEELGLPAPKPEALTLLSLGVDTERYLLQFSYLWETDYTLSQVSRCRRNRAPTAGEQTIFFVPLEPSVCEAFLCQAAFEPGAAYSLMRLLQKRRG